MKVSIDAIPTTAMRGTDSAATAVNLAIVDTVVDGIQTDLDNGTDGLGALKTLVDNVQSDTDDIQTRLPTALIGGRMDSDVEAINNNTESAIDLSASARTIVRATVDTVTNSHTPTTTVFQADDITEATADHFNGRSVYFTSGVLKDQGTDITDYEAVGGIGQFTVTAMTEAPVNNDTFVVI